MTKIEVQTVAGGLFDVRVIEGQGESRHRVTLDAEYYQRLTSQLAPESAGRKVVSPQDLIQRSFEFLLERESKECILPKFDLRVIARYFPEYENEIRNRR